VNRPRTFLAAALLAALAPLGAAAQSRDMTGLATSTLPNGMEVFILENHTVPLARIQITFRTGAISQTPKTAGLFHLYEHMLFKGNAAHPTQTDLQAAMKDLGVGDWNGGTAQESVSYYFTVPAEKMGKGVAFWADAVRSPLLDETELATEKDVVVNEIRGYLSDPDGVYGSAVEKAMFWQYPWRKDVGGSEALIRAATPQVMRDIRDTWYVPNNAALFVGGDVDPAAVKAAVLRSFGDWKRGKDPWASPPPPHPSPRGDASLVYANEQMYAGVAAVDLRFRGPDAGRDPASTYAADVLLKLLDDPNGRFKSGVFARVPGLYKKEYIQVSYPTQRDGGTLSFSTFLLISPREDSFARMAALKKAFLDEAALIVSTPDYFSERDFTVLKGQLADDRIWERETVDGFIGTLSFWWAAAGTDYYKGYTDALSRVTRADLVKLINAYLTGKPSVLAAQMNPQDFAREKASAQKQGWGVVTKDNAYWWAETPAGGAQ
jgi:zinc protease